MADYKAGHIKRDPDTGTVAIRTAFPDTGPLAAHAWLVATTRQGAFAKATSDVAAWDDLYAPTEAET